MISQITQGFYQKLRLYPETWTSTTAYAVGDIVKAVTYASKSYLVTTAGTTGSAEPSWSTSVGNTVSSGTCIFTVKDGSCYQVKAPQNSTLPYVTFGLNTEVPIGDFSDFETVENLTYWVNCFSSKSTADVNELSDEVMDALDNATLTVSGYTSLKCQREYIGSTIWDSETNVYQTPLRYRVWCGK
jgi:hypothetical protein